MMNSASRAAAREAYDAGETQYNGIKLAQDVPGAGLASAFKSGNSGKFMFFKDAPTGATNRYITNPNGTKTYGLGNGSTPIAPGPRLIT